MDPNEIELERVDELIKREALREVKDEITICPRCKSAQTKHALSIAFIGAPVVLPENKIKCQSCGFKGIGLNVSAKEYQQYKNSEK
ncbi:MAG: hypothetical protein ACE5DI_01390 [Candidatus Micrarchaeia archaeon]